MNTRPLDDTPFIAPFVPCPLPLLQAALPWISVLPEDIVMDLGCGDGRILREVAQYARPRRVIGVELDPYLAQHARDSLLDGSVPCDAQILEQDLFQVDLEALEVSVIIVYLLPRGLDQLRPQLGSWLSNQGSGHRRFLVTVDYPVPSWPTDDAAIKENSAANCHDIMVERYSCQMDTRSYSLYKYQARQYIA